MSDIIGWKDKGSLYFERSGYGTIKFNLTDREFYRPLKSGKDRKIKPPSAFFRKLDASEVAESFLDEPAYGKFIKKIDTAETRLSNVASLLNRAADFAHLEGYLVLGIDFSMSRSTYSRYGRTYRNFVFTQPVSIYTKEVLAFMRESRIRFNSNYWEQHFLENKEFVTNICTHIRRKYHNDLEVYRLIYDVLNGYSDFDTLKELVNEYNCELGHLLDYLVYVNRVEAVPFDNAIDYLKDYLSMNKQMGKRNFDKYPTHLHTAHDVVDRNFKVFQKTYDEEEFKKNVNYELEHKGVGWKVIAPKTTQDVKDEGTNLNHCVGSYVQKILDGTTQILFLRTDEEDSLLTVEVRDGRIIQAKGDWNRNPTPTEKRWLQIYAEKKGLTYVSV